MSTLVCDQVRQSIIVAIETGQLPLLSTAERAHLAECTLCQGALTLLLATLGNVVDLDPITCVACQKGLPAFIDLEANEGIATAHQQFPHIWWHLWQCQECGETYRLTRALLHAERQGELAPLHTLLPQPKDAPTAPRPTSRVVPTRSPFSGPLHLPHAMIAQSLGMRSLLGNARGTGGGEVVLVEEDVGEHMLTLSVQLQRDGNWRMTIAVDPPFMGNVRATAGGATYDASFNSTGEAVFLNLPAALLTGADAQDMEVAVEVDDKG